MRKRRVYLLVLILAVVGLVGVIVTGAFRPRESDEPMYKGRKLSEWVRVLHRSGGIQWNDYVNGRDDVNGRYQAVEAIHQIGTNAFPYCLKWIRYEQPTWKTKLYRAAEPVLKRVNAHWELTDEKEARAAGAEEVLMRMGPIGAIPELSAVLGDPKAIHGAGRAAGVLSYLGDGGLLALLPALTNPQATARCKIYGALAIQRLGTNASPAIPALLHLLGDPDLGVRRCATNALREIDPKTVERDGQ